MSDAEYLGDVVLAPPTPMKFSINGIVEIDESGFWFRGEKIDDAGQAHRALLVALYGGDAAAAEIERLKSKDVEVCNDNS